MADIPEIHDVQDDGDDVRQTRRIERERAMLAVGEAQIARGEFLEEDELERWLSQLDKDPNAALPLRPGRRR